MKGGRLSRPKHCSKDAQPVLEAIYRSSCRDKHNCQRCDSNLGPLTPQSDALTTRLLRPALIHSCVYEPVSSMSVTVTVSFVLVNDKLLRRYDRNGDTTRVAR